MTGTASELNNDIVARSVKLAFESGVHSERHRTVGILEQLKKEFNGNDYSKRTIAVAIKRIESGEFAKNDKA
jgi:hypothetical protein